MAAIVVSDVSQLNTDQADVALFQHQRLEKVFGAIRLITISPQLSAAGLIQCNIVHATISGIEYVCLSYRWGPPAPVKIILINGKQFAVRQNLFDFLENVRPTWNTSLWIDAMCIDQSNISERNHQVGQMGVIFSRALTVCVWLGKMAPMLPIMKVFKKRKRDPEAVTLDDWSTVSAGNVVKDHISNNEYWTRAWVRRHANEQ